MAVGSGRTRNIAGIFAPVTKGRGLVSQEDYENVGSVERPYPLPSNRLTQALPETEPRPREARC